MDGSVCPPGLMSLVPQGKKNMRRNSVLSVLFSSALVSTSSLYAGPVEPPVRLSIEAPSAEMTTGAEFGARVTMRTFVEGVQGWSLGVGHDPSVLSLLSSEAGDFTQIVNEGDEPQFLVIDDMPRGDVVGVTMAVVISFTEPITVPLLSEEDPDFELLRLSYAVVGDPTAVDPCEPIETSVFFANDINVPEVQTVVTVNGSTATPERIDAPITVRCPGSIEITRCEGDTENVFLEWAFGGTPTWDFLFLYRDGELLAELAPDATSYTDEGLEPGDFVYTVVTFAVEDPALPVLFFATCTATVIPVTIASITPAIDSYVGGREVVITGTAFTTLEGTTVSFFAEGEEPLVLEVLEVVSETELRAIVPPSPRLGGYSIRLENERGAAELFDAFSYGFIRGETNSDGVIDISDAINIVNSLFLGEGEILCLDAADTTDDAQIDISDAIRVFRFLFSGGAPPEQPHPEPGFDETEDSFGCLSGIEV